VLCFLFAIFWPKDYQEDEKNEEIELDEIKNQDNSRTDIKIIQNDDNIIIRNLKRIKNSELFNLIFNIRYFVF
jgi:hypothetical protein